MSALLRRPLALAFACWVAFAGVLVAAYWVPSFRWADGHAVEGLLGLQRPWLDDLAIRVAHMANPVPFALVSAALVAIALIRGRPRLAVGVLVLLVGANATAQYLKDALAHDRAQDFLSTTQISAAAFPSGHATASMSLAFAAVIVAPVALRRVVAIAGALFALGVSESILLLAYHYPSDVIGGYLIATSFACAVVWAIRAADARWPERTGREAARRAFRETDVRPVAAVFALLAVVTLIALAIAYPDGAIRFADRHTTAFVAVLGVAGMAAALPAAIAALSSPRT